MWFIGRMAARELRAAWRRLVFFFLCVAVGVGTVVALRSLIQNLRVALMSEARTLTAADVYLRSDQPWTDEVNRIIEERLATLPDVARTETMDTVTMARPADERSVQIKVVELRGVQRSFPFYGRFVLGSGRPYSFDLLQGWGALVGADLLTHLDLAIGDEIIIGQLRFTIRDVVLSEPGRQLGAFSFGPRVLVDYEAMRDTGLLTLGSRAERQILLKIDEVEVDPLVEKLREDLSEAFVRVGSYRRTQSRIERNLNRTENYLSLVGFVTLILGGIGVWSVTRVFVQQRLRTVAILKCLGATSGRVLSVYVAQVALLGLGGSLLGIGVAYLALIAVPDSLTEHAASVTGLTIISGQLTASAVVQGLAIGLFVCVMFALVPLIEIRHVKPLLLIRQEQNSTRVGVDWTRVVAVGVTCAGLILMATWQAGSLKVGAYVVGGFVGVAFVLHQIGCVLVGVIRPLEESRWFPLRHAVLHLIRPGNQTRVILLAVGLGSFFIIGVRTLQTNLLSNLALELRDDTPDMFLIDIQQDQAAGMRSVLARSVTNVPQLIPVLRTRVVGLDGRTLSINGVQEARRAGLGREYTITYRSQLEENERIVAGRFWDDTPSPSPEVSIEERLYREKGLQLGDFITFDVLGRQVTARVTSVRAVDWDDSRSGGFMFLFRPGVFDNAPHTFIAFMKGPEGSEARARLQRDIVVEYPNVSVIDGLEIIGMLRGVLDYVTKAISLVGGIALFSGGLILIGSVAMTKYQRLYEVAILKTLGATKRAVVTMLILEYGVLGTLAGFVGSIGALILTWVLARQVFEIAWYPAATENLIGILVTAVVVAAVGVVSNLDVLRRKPLAILRAE